MSRFEPEEPKSIPYRDPDADSERVTLEQHDEIVRENQRAELEAAQRNQAEIAAKLEQLPWRDIWFDPWD